MGFKNLVSVLLQKNANCNLLTLPPLDFESISLANGANNVVDPFAEDEVASTPSDPGRIPPDAYNQTPLHLAILGRHDSIIKEILSYHDRASRKGRLDSALLTPDLNIKNSKHQTPLSLAGEICSLLSIHL